MKLLVLSMLVAVAVAGPAQRFLQPDVSGPTPIVNDREPISIGPAIVNPEPIVIGPAIIDPEPIVIGPAIVDESVVIPAPVVTPEAPTQPLVQIIINVNGQGQVIGNPVVVSPAPVETEIKPEPVIVVEEAAEPVQVVEIAPGVVGTPVLPGIPAITLPEELN